MVDNRRRDTRHEVSITAEVSWNEQTLEACTKNVSASGCSLVLDGEIPDGVSIALSLMRTHAGIEDPDLPPLELRADVMWAAESDDGDCMVGVRFSGLTAAQQVALAALIETSVQATDAT